MLEQLKKEVYEANMLLPKYDLFSARNLVESIAKQIFVMNNRRTDMKLKAVTVSAGISAAPYAARTVKELMEKHYPYHPKADSIVLYENGVEVSDDELLSSLVLITVSHDE